MAGLDGQIRSDVHDGWVREAWAQAGAPEDLRTAGLEVVAAVARSVSAKCGVPLPEHPVHDHRGDTGRGDRPAGLADPRLTAASASLRTAVDPAPGDRAAVVLIGPSESSLLLLRDVALALDELLPTDVGVYGVGCYDPYRPGYRRPLPTYATRLANRDRHDPGAAAGPADRLLGGRGLRPRRRCAPRASSTSPSSSSTRTCGAGSPRFRGRPAPGCSTR